MASTAAASTPPPVQDDGPLTHKQIVTILIGLMMGMFLAALDQTIVAIGHADDRRRPQGLAGQAWVTTAYLITSTIVTPLYGKLVRHLRAQEVVHHRHHDLHRRLGAVHVRDLDRACWPRSARSRASAPAACSRWPWRSSATSCRRVSAPSTRATSWPSSAPRASSARSSAASSPARRPSSASPAGAGSSSSTCRSASPPSSSSSRTLHLQHTRLDHRIDWWGAVALTVGLVPLLHRRRAGPRVGLGLRQLDRLLRHRRRSGVVAFFVVERAMGEEALIPLRLFRNRTVGVSSIASVHHRHGHVRRHRRAARSTCRSSRAPRRPQAGLLLLPMTLGIMFGSIVSGQIISRTGRYRHFPIIGAGAARRSRCFAFHYVGADTPLWKTMIVMVFFGVGPRLQLPAADPRRAERGRAARHRRGHLVGDVHPPDRRHARHGRVPVDPVLQAAREDLRRPSRPIAPTPDFQAALKAAQGERRGQQGRSSGLQQRRPAAAAARSTARSRTPRSSSSSTRAWPSRSSSGFSEAMRHRVPRRRRPSWSSRFVVLCFLPHVELRSGSSYAERGRAAADDADSVAVPPAVAH